MAISDGAEAMRRALQEHLELIPVFAAGETLTIQRNVKGQNVLMVVEARDPCSLGPHMMLLRATMKTWGVSSYADGRVAAQRDSIDRLLKEREQALKLAIKYGATEIVDLLTAPREGIEEL
jgi:hypothetical protein